MSIERGKRLLTLRIVKLHIKTRVITVEGPRGTNRSPKPSFALGDIPI